jgi:hypothetical protein
LIPAIQLDDLVWRDLCDVGSRIICKSAAPSYKLVRRNSNTDWNA